MEGYFAAGGTLIGTSNAAPDALYAGGINRQTFAPFVDVLRVNCEIVDLDEEGGIDYRRRPGDSSTSAVADVVIVGDDDAARRRLAATWERFRATSGETSDESVGSVDIPVGKTRTIRAMRRIGDRAVWFTFDDLCGRKSRAAPRDYIALAETFSMICVQDVPRMPTSTAENDARRFINLIDVLYERRVVLLTNLAVHSDELFDELGDAARRGRDLSLRERTRAENAASGQLAVTAVGGSSGRSTTMLATDTEWSATGRVGASLADVSAKNFTALAGPRCVSRLAHMARLPDYRPDLLPNFIHVES